MKALIILGHQNPGESFCRAVAETAKQALQTAGYDVIFHDLYAEKFDPVLTAEELSLSADEVSGKIREDIQEVLDADFYVIVHPNWWGMPPAILKGWIDRVIRQGFCYAFTAEGPVKKLAGRKAVVFTTGNTPPDVEIQVLGDPLENLWKNIVFDTVGVTDFIRRNFASVIMSTPQQRQEWLQEVQQIIQKMA
ncbi:MAG: NAD(P)H-dependent oxidoreductase [Planctomycetia bacterium]|nr:NAD(P)H-dependent oxidoreductase [Planctomycetia bacterium]